MALTKKCRHGKGLKGRARMSEWLRCGCTWYADLHGPEGRRYVALGADHKIAERRHDDLARDVHAGVALPKVESIDGGDGFAAVARRWYTAHSEKLGRSTRRGYEASLRAAVDFFGGTSVRSINAAQLGRLEAELLRREYAAGTVTNVRMVVGMVLRHAVHEELIPTAPQAPRSKARRNRPRPTVIKPDDLKRVLAHLPAEVAQITEFTYLTGLRRSEALGLKGTDVHRVGDRVYVTVERQLHAEGDEGPPKNGLPRDVDLSPRAVALIPNRRGYLWGEVVSHSTWWEKLRFALVAEGLPWNRPVHMLRHSNMALRLTGGQNIAYASGQLGHQDSAFTLRTYGHYLPNAQTDDAGKLDRAMGHHTDPPEPFGRILPGGSTGGE